MALHAKFHFEKVGHFKEVGFKFGRWLDVVYMELILEKLADLEVGATKVMETSATFNRV